LEEQVSQVTREQRVLLDLPGHQDFPQTEHLAVMQLARELERLGGPEQPE